MKEETKEKFDYGCVMLYYDFPEIEDSHNIIDPNDIYHQEGDRSFGLEDEPHTTLLFGLHDDVTDEDVSKVLNKYKYSTCKLHNPSLFEKFLENVEELADIAVFDESDKDYNSAIPWESVKKDLGLV